MKLIAIQRHFFRIKSEKNRVFFCTEAKHDFSLNVQSIQYIEAIDFGKLPYGWENLPTMTICEKDLDKIEISESLGMAYKPVSELPRIITSVPDSMSDDIHNAMSKLKEAVGGSVDFFVCDRLNWTIEELNENLLAEQVDSVALAIYNIEARKQALIIGDQTGIGKGRMAASLIRYGYVHNILPIFITEKASLFTDIYRDLKDIGCVDLKPFFVKGNKEFGVPDLEIKHRNLADKVTELIRGIISFEKRFINPVIDKTKEDAEDDGGSAQKSSKELGVSRVSYFSKVFRVVNQLLFSIKAEAVADHAIRRMKEGNKVVIAFSDTYEAMLNDLLGSEADTEKESDTRIIDGEEVNCDLSVSLLRGLRNTLAYNEKKEGSQKSIKKFIEIDELTIEGQKSYYELENQIKHATTGVTASPIDLIVRKITQAGFTCGKVTGRKRMIDFANADGTRGVVKARKGESKTKSFAQFQNNILDCLLINMSGSTGASAHATFKGTNLKAEEVRPRVMIIAQAELNISTEVQKRGRINRTGQLVELPPSYDYLTSAIPAEKRLMMMLQKKLKSLDANTTSNQKQSTNIIDTDDFINKYGDEVVIEYMQDNVSFTENLY